MSPQTQKRGKGGTRKIGRAARKPTHQRYNSEGRFHKNKIKRIFKSNGEKAARAYAKEYPITSSILRRLIG
jgi:hypothetical protein